MSSPRYSFSSSCAVYPTARSAAVAAPALAPARRRTCFQSPMSSNTCRNGIDYFERIFNYSEFTGFYDFMNILWCRCRGCICTDQVKFCVVETILLTSLMYHHTDMLTQINRLVAPAGQVSNILVECSKSFQNNTMHVCVTLQCLLPREGLCPICYIPTPISCLCLCACLF